jgi:cysteine desulfurase / selenocysteine lyase
MGTMAAMSAISREAMNYLSLELGKPLRKRFPFFKAAQPSVYLDSAATAQKPAEVVEVVRRFLETENANVHRGAYALSGEATERFEATRTSVSNFLALSKEFTSVFTHGTTESLNLLAYGLEPLLKSGDTILLSLLEHHSNIVPWQILAQRKKLNIIWAPISDAGTLLVDECKTLIATYRPRIVSLTHISNALGTIVPVAEIFATAKKIQAFTVLDIAQSVAHLPVSLIELGADFAAFSGHKLYGPTGVGVLAGRSAILESMSPFMAGGGMISQVTTAGTQFLPAPHKFEAGTPPIAEVLGLAPAIAFVEELGLARIADHENKLLNNAFDRLSRETDVKLYGPRTTGIDQSAILAFTVKGVHPHDLSTVADASGVQFRAGHHCAMPLHARLGVPATARISFAAYNDVDDIDRLIEAIRAARKRFA